MSGQALKDSKKLIQDLRATLAAVNARCLKHVGHEHCITPCDSIRLQEQNHNSWLIMKERAEKAQAALAAMTKQRDDYREGARIEAAEGDLARKENDELRAALAEAVSIFSEFRRCTEAKKLPDDHHDDDEYCEEGTCMWIGEQATDFIARLKQAQEGPKP